MNIKDKLLKAVKDIDTHEMDESVLIDILVDKIKSQADEIERLRGENAHEEMRLYSAREAIQKEIREMHSNPFYGATGPIYFLGQKGEKFSLIFQGGVCKEIYQRKKDIDYNLRQVSPAEWENANA